MADITDQHDQTSPTELDESQNVGNGSAATESRGIKRQRPSAGDDDDDDDEKGGRERRKIEIKFISDKSRRHITFSKRKAGIMKKAYELSVLTGTQVLLLVVSETGLVYTFTTPKLQPLVTKAEGKNLIQACLNAPEPTPGNENGVDGGDQVESPEEPANQHLPLRAADPVFPRTLTCPATICPPTCPWIPSRLWHIKATCNGIRATVQAYPRNRACPPTTTTSRNDAPSPKMNLWSLIPGAQCLLETPPLDLARPFWTSELVLRGPGDMALVGC
ncbi:transcription factor of the MADS box [Fusarium falciforme]|nr:transcription factor of the MADS box [Fusarium falciforme]